MVLSRPFCLASDSNRHSRSTVPPVTGIVPMSHTTVNDPQQPHGALAAADEPKAPGETAPACERLREAIEHAAHYLPAQGPIQVFIHHNTLHAFEHLPFDEGVQQGAAVFGCQPYLSEDRYHELIDQGRIREEDLSAALIDDLRNRADELLGCMGTRYELRLKMLKYRLRIAPEAELRWFVAESDALRKFRDDAPPAARRQFIEETRHWVMRHLRNGGWVE